MVNMYLIGFFLISILSIEAFNLNPFSRSVLGDVKIMKPFNSEFNSSVVFIPMTDYVTGDFYSNFAYYLTGRNLKVCIPDPDMDKTNNLLIEMVNNNENITIVSHSSGVDKAVSLCNNFNIKKLVMIDAVNTNDIFNQKRKYNLNSVDDLVLCNTKKSYKWSIRPRLPLGLFLVKPENIITTADKLVIESPDYGHFDLLDKKWSDIMDKTISKGCDDRSVEKLESYQNWVANIISHVCNDELEKIESDNTIKKIFYSIFKIR